MNPDTDKKRDFARNGPENRGKRLENNKNGIFKAGIWW